MNDRSSDLLLSSEELAKKRRRRIILIVIVTILGLMLLGASLIPNIARDGDAISEDLLYKIISLIENGDEKAFKEMFIPEFTIDDEKVQQIFALYKGTIVSSEKIGNSYSKSVGTSNISCTFLVITTESSYKILINHFENSEKSGLFYFSITTEDTVTLP